MRLKAEGAGRIFIFLIISLFVLFSYQRNWVWLTEISLWEDVAKKSPLKVRPHFNLGLAYLNRNRFELAEKSLRMTLSLYPDYHKAKYYLAEALYNLGSYEEALKYLKEVEFLYINVLPHFPEKWEGVSMAFSEADLYNNIASCYYGVNNLRSAEEYYRKALLKDRFHIYAIKGLITVLADEGRIVEAIRLLEDTIRDMPPSLKRDELVEILWTLRDSPEPRRR